LTVDPPYDTEQCARAIRPIAQMPGADPDLLGLILGGRSEQALAAATLREQQQAYEARVAGYGEWVATLERHAEEYRQWLEDLEATTAELRASCADYARDNEELRARARARSLRVGPLLRRLRKLLD
jgi:chromosome segregation ATPase